MGLSVLRTAGPRANGILSIRCDRSTRPAASDARLTRTSCRVPCTTKHGHAAHYFAEPWPEHYTRYRSALYNSPYRSAPLESRDHPFCYEGFNHPGRIYCRHAAALATPLPPAWSRSLTCQEVNTNVAIGFAARHSTNWSSPESHSYTCARERGSATHTRICDVVTEAARQFIPQ